MHRGVCWIKQRNKKKKSHTSSHKSSNRKSEMRRNSYCCHIRQILRGRTRCTHEPFKLVKSPETPSKDWTGEPKIFCGHGKLVGCSLSNDPMCHNNWLHRLESLKFARKNSLMCSWNMSAGPLRKKVTLFLFSHTVGFVPSRTLFVLCSFFFFFFFPTLT